MDDWTCCLVEYKDKKVVNCVISSGGFTLTCICREAFKDCICMESLFLTDSIETIDDYAFKNCVSLKELHLPTQLYSLGSNIFCDCISLKEMVIPESVMDLSHESLLTSPYLLKAIILNSELDLTDSLLGYYLIQSKLYKKINNLTIYGYKNSTAEHYAKEHGFKFVPLD